MVEPVIEWRAGDADAAIAHVGKVGQPEPARRMLLPEDDVLLGPVQRPPGADAPLQRATDAAIDLGVAATDLVENGDRPQTRGALEQRHHLTVPDFAQRVRPAPAARYLLLRRELGVILDAIRGGGAEPGLGRSNSRRLALAETHVQPHLAIGDVATGQGAVPHRREEPASYPAGRDRQPTRPFQGRAVRRIRNVSRATPSCRHASGDSFSSRLTRPSHPVCRAAKSPSSPSRSAGEP
jgi:hypothetical protein